MPCPDLAEALAFFTDRLGFRLEWIFPADAPRMAKVTGHGLGLRLCSGAAPSPAAAPGGLHIGNLDAGSAFQVGRAGMEYRDLVPDRRGGSVIASHIRIREGGPVPDYVHFHEVRAQFIYCYRGWVEVVYEDQGPPFVLQPGDCVLQPPGIRHRVLRCSDGLEVVELSSPAEHLTLQDHELALPTATRAPERDFGGQRFVRFEAEQARFGPADDAGLQSCDLGMAAATGGRVLARVLRRDGSGQGGAMLPGGPGFCLRFVLSGSAWLRHEQGEARLYAGTALVLPAGEAGTLTEMSPDLSWLELSLPDPY